MYSRRTVLVPTVAAVAMVAVDATARATASGCGVTYPVSSQWAAGFGANVTVNNLPFAAVSGSPASTPRSLGSRTIGVR